MRTITVCATGHRPKGLPWGYNEPPKIKASMKRWIEKLSAQNGNAHVHVISGMALGIDQIWAKAGIEARGGGANVTVEAAVPFLGQEAKWPMSSQKVYNAILSQCDKTTVVSEGGYANEKMQIRNEYMVDHSDICIAFWNGNKGGTGNCVEYAKKVGRKMFIVNPNVFMTKPAVMETVEEVSPIVELHTGCFFREAQYEAAGKLDDMVSIALYAPRGFRGKQYNALAPSNSLLQDYRNGSICEAVYEDRYRREVLSKLNPAQVAQDLSGKILCCWEQPGEFCHRRIVAEWLTEAGYSCKELI